MMMLLAYRPFIDPVETLAHNSSEYWLWLLIPLVIAISVVYRGTKVRELRELPIAAAKLSFQILVIMAGLAVGLYGLYFFVIHR